MQLAVVLALVQVPLGADPGPGEIAASAGSGPAPPAPLASGDASPGALKSIGGATPAEPALAESDDGSPTPAAPDDLPAPSNPTPHATTVPGLAPMADSASEPASNNGNNGTGFRLGPTPATPAPTKPSTSLPWYAQIFDQKLPIKFGIIAAEVSSDNIFYQPHKTNDLITEISPFVNLQLGTPINLYPTLDEETIYSESDSGDLNYLSVEYHPTITLYERNSFLNVVDEYADALYAHQFSKLTLSVEQQYQKLSQPTVQENTPGALIHRDIYTTVARANYIYSDKLSTYGTFTQTVRDYKNFYSSSTEWNGDYYFLYQLFPKLSVGAGSQIGFVKVENGANQSYQAALLHAVYPATGKLSFLLSAGAEIREYEHNASPTQVSPTFDAEGLYKPFDSMTFTLAAGRHHIVFSSLSGEDYTASTVSLQFRQRFLQVIYFKIQGGYEDDEYTGSTDGISPTRQDGYFYTSAGLEWDSKDWLSVAANYQYSEDDSNVKIYSFNNNEFRVAVTLRY